MTPLHAWLLLLLAPAVPAQVSYTQYTQPDDIISGAYDDYSRNPPTVCARTCNGQPKICYWKFDIQLYSAMGPACRGCPNVTSDCFLSQCVPADGFQRSIITANRMLPGPSMQVCLGDTIVVDVVNEMIGKQTTIHWHGILQKGTPWMDGVYMVTQCPITPGQTFRYKFRADRPGTHYWHDHSGLIKVDGLQGALVVRETPTGVNNMNLYNFDLPSHVLFIHDWKHFIADADLPDEIELGNNKQVDAFLINGKGVYINNPTEALNPLRDYQAASKTPIHVMSVNRGGRYRVRLVGGMCMSCGIRFSIDGHRMLLIASDGDPLQPVWVDHLNIFPGERYDVVLEANQAVNTYWMIVKGVGQCRVSYQVGALRYAGSTRAVPGSNTLRTPPMPLTGNSVEGGCNSATELCLSQLRSTAPPPSQIYSYQRNYRQVIQFGFYQYNNDIREPFNTPGEFPPYYMPIPGVLVRPLINNISFAEPSSPLLTQYGDNPQSKFCNSQCRTYLAPARCVCIDPVVVPLNAVVDMIVTDTDSSDFLTHPFHLHGHVFYVLEEGILGPNYDASLQGLMRRVEQGNVSVNYPPGKDTVTILNGGYAIIRLLADNPGMWLMHCHFLYHHLMGMTTVLQVGDRSQFPPPPQGFPRCGNFYPNY